MFLQRLQNDFRFALIVLFSAVTALSILPIAVYRFATGALLIGVIDLAVVIGIALNVVYVCRGGSVERAGLVAVVIAATGTVAVARIMGLAGLMWVYPVMVATYVLVRPRLAILASALTIAGAVLLGTGYESTFMRVGLAVTAALVSLFAYIFAQRTELQNAQLQELVTRDPLTSAFNRRAMEQELPIAIETSRRTQAPAALMVIDLDHFKRINDSAGHEGGDRVLVDFVRVMTESARRGDRLFRYGGEEFVLLLPGLAPDALGDVAEALRARVASELQADGHPVTVSIGAASLAPGETAAAWLARADAATYRAKREGRDRVVIAPPPPTATVVPLVRRGEPRTR